MTDQFAHFDGAYVLGALSDEERAAYEAHLETCPACRERVTEIAGLPDLLSGISLDDLRADDPGPVPDTLLPSLVRKVRTSRRRRVFLAAAVSVAAAFIAAIVAVTATNSASPTTSPPVQALAGQQLHQLYPSPIHASVVLASQPWGTRVIMHCRYGSGDGGKLAYGMTVVDRTGTRHPLGSWWIAPGETLTFAAPTSLNKGQIREVDVTLPNGTPILKTTV